MHLREATPAPIVKPSRRFEALREVTATVGKTLPVPSPEVEIMRAARLRCQGGGPERTGAECLACHRIVSIRPSPGRSYVTIRCLWTDDDPVASVMTRPAAIVRVQPSTARGLADQIATRAGVHHLLVVDEREVVVGSICRCRLADAGSPAGLWPVARFMNEIVWTIPLGTSLGEAADAMEGLGVGVLVVADGDQLLGMVTLRELGLVEEGHQP
jgi:CBS domain-containing protein